MSSNNKILDILLKDEGQGKWSIKTNQIEKTIQFFKKNKVENVLLGIIMSLLAVEAGTYIIDNNKSENSLLKSYLNSTDIQNYHINNESKIKYLVDDVKKTSKENKINFKISIGAGNFLPDTLSTSLGSYFVKDKMGSFLRLGAENQNDFRSYVIFYHEFYHALYYNKTQKGGNFLEPHYGIEKTVNLYNSKQKNEPYNTYLLENNADIFGILSLIRLSQINPDLKNDCIKSIEALLAVRSVNNFDFSHPQATHLKRLYEEFSKKDLKALTGAEVLELTEKIGFDKNHQYSWSFEEYWFNFFSVYYFTFSGEKVDKNMHIKFEKEVQFNIKNDQMLNKWELSNFKNHFLDRLLNPAVYKDLTNQKDIKDTITIWFAQFQPKKISMENIIEKKQYLLNMQNNWKTIAYYVDQEYQLKYHEKPKYSYEETSSIDNLPAQLWAASQYVINLPKMDSILFDQYNNQIKKHDKKYEQEYEAKIDIQKKNFKLVAIK